MNRKEPVRPAVACLLFALVILYAATGHAARSWNSDIEMTLVDDDGEGSTLTNVVLRGDSPRFVAHAYQFPPWAWRIIPPANGCGRGIATPAESAAVVPGGCAVVSNGGFFDPSDVAVVATDGPRNVSLLHPCLGISVGSGVLLNPLSPQLSGNPRLATIFVPTRDTPLTSGRASSRSQWAIATGYVNVTDRESMRPWQLMSGQGWIVRNGGSNVESAMDSEDWSIQRTGSAQRFRSIRAPRTALGHDAAGRLILALVDGEEGLWDGVTLDELADIMISLGAANAINLDGGGSSSVFVHGALANVPSDDCKEDRWNAPSTDRRPNASRGGHERAPRFKCPRPVATAVCISSTPDLPFRTRSRTPSMSRTDGASPSQSVSSTPSANVSRGSHDPQKSVRLVRLPFQVVAALVLAVWLGCGTVVILIICGRPTAATS